MVLILGAGLAGLSAALHLDGRDRLLVERDAEVGGLCRSIRERGFTFDHTGHLLHLRDPAIRALVDELLPDAFLHLERSAWIRSHGALTPYPFQVNTAGLPLEVRLQCLLGFIETLRRPDRRTAGPVPDPVPVDPALPFLGVAPEVRAGEPSFRDWIHEVFGAGFARHFFLPYNTKLFRCDLAEITGDWVSWAIPRPELTDVLRGALQASDKAFGYNPRFLYPAAGGIDALPRALAARLPAGVVRPGVPAQRVEAGRRRVTLAGGETHDAEAVLSTLPLTRLAGITADLPADLRDAAAELRHVSVRAVNLGVRGEAIHPGVQWVYFPDPAIPFYRIGQPTALTPAMAPAGHHSFAAEIALRPDERVPAEQSLSQTVEALVREGFLRDASDVVHARVLDIPEAYVIFDAARRRVLPRLFRFYLDHGIVPLGRYGTWDYLAMEDCLRQGRQAAAWAAGRTR